MHAPSAWSATLLLVAAACGGDPQTPPAPADPAGAGVAGAAARSAGAPLELPPPSRIWLPEQLPQLIGPVKPQPDAAGQAERARRTAEGDDWETERLHARSLPVLEGLVAALLEARPAAPPDLARWLAEPFGGASDLRPEVLRTVFDSGHVRVLEPEPAPPQTRALEALLGSAARLREALGDERPATFATTVIAIDPSGEGGFDTRVLLQLDGWSADGPVQVNATWELSWTLGEDGQPRVRSLHVASYQEVRAVAELFAEVSEAAFGALPPWRSEFLRGVDDWYMRIDRGAGVSFQGMQGLAVGDVNGDGLDDVYVCQQVGLPNRLLVRAPDGTVRDRAGEAKVDFLDSTSSALIVDLDGDGHRDLALAIGNMMVVAYNDGSGAFPRQRAIVAEGGERFFSLSAADFDRDGDLDVFGSRYSMGGVMHGAPTPYHDADNGATNYLWRNDGIGVFTDVTAAAGMDVNNKKFSLTSLWEDIDDDGDLDLYVINDFGRNNLWRNDGAGRFEDVAGALGLEDIGAGMGISCGDYDLDGDLDLYVTNMFAASGLRTAGKERFLGGGFPQVQPWYVKHASGNTLLARQADGTYLDVTAAAGTGRGGWAWGAMFTDFDADGYLDLYVPNGHTTSRGRPFDLESYFWRRVVAQSPVDPALEEAYRTAFDEVQNMVMFELDSWNGHERNNAYLNLGDGRFAEVSHISGAGFVEDSRCVATLDWDDDGRQDLLIKGRTAPRLRLLLGRDTSGHHFASFELAARGTNRDAIGARVTVTAGGRPRARTVYAGDGYLCQSTRRLLFGLGEAEEVDSVQVRWPDGATSSYGRLPVDRRWRLEQGRAEAIELPRRPASALEGLDSARAERNPAPVDRVVLAARMPMAPFPLPAFEGGQRRVADFQGRPLLLHVWTADHDSGTEALAGLAAAAPALADEGVAVVCLSVDEGLALVRSRKAIGATPFAPEAGYLDGRTREAFSLIVLEVLGFFDGVPLPTSLLLDAAGQACVLYLGPVDPRTVVDDARLVGALNPRMRGTLRLTGGRWLNTPQRDFELLARALEGAGFEDLAKFFHARAAVAAGVEPDDGR